MMVCISYPPYTPAKKCVSGLPRRAKGRHPVSIHLCTPTIGVDPAERSPSISICDSVVPPSRDILASGTTRKPRTCPVMLPDRWLAARPSKLESSLPQDATSEEGVQRDLSGKAKERRRGLHPPHGIFSGVMARPVRHIFSARIVQGFALRARVKPVPYQPNVALRMPLTYWRRRLERRTHKAR